MLHWKSMGLNIQWLKAEGCIFVFFKSCLIGTGLLFYAWDLVLMPYWQNVEFYSIISYVQVFKLN